MIAPHSELLLGDSRVLVEAIPWQAGGMCLMAAVDLVEAIPWQAGGLCLMPAVILVEAILWQAGGLHLMAAVILVEAILWQAGGLHLMAAVILLWTPSSGCCTAALSLGTTAHQPPSAMLCLHPGCSACPKAPCVLDPHCHILCLFCVPSPSAHKHS